MKKLFHELLRRDVIKVAVIYVIVAWILVQVAIAVAPALLLPEWTDTMVIFLLGIGFPVALILAWAYELSPKGVTPTQPELAASGLTAIGATIGAHVAVEDVPFLPPERSIAVLPFVNMSNDEEQEFFSDGISEELLNCLAKIGSFRVAARTSSFAYKGKEQDISVIGKALNVGHVLEGSVRKAAGKVRITAQLIETDTGFHLWSDSYDRALDDIFAIQDEISAAITNAMREHILGEVPKLAITQKTDMQTFELFLKGKQLVDRRGRDNIEAGHVLLKQAVAIDPTYAPALAGLAEAIMLGTSKVTGYGEISKQVGLAESKDLLDRAMVIDPHSAEVHSILAQYYNLANDVEKAAKHVDLALQANPNFAPAYARQHFSRIYMGNPHMNSIASLRRALELDPASIPSLFNLCYRLGDRLDKDGAEEAMNAIIKIDDRVGARLLIETDRSNHRGDIADALKLSRAGTELQEVGTSFQGIVDESLSILRMAPEDMFIDSSVSITSYLCGKDKGQILERARHFSKQAESDYAGVPAFQILANGWGGKETDALALLERFSKVDGWGTIYMLDLVPVIPPMLARLRREAGDEAGAQLTIAKLKEYYEVEDQHPDGRHMTLDLLGAAIAMLEGNKDLALNRLEKQLDRVWYVVSTVRADPLYEPLHDDPRYKAINDAVDARAESEIVAATEMGLLPVDLWLTQDDPEIPSP